MSYPRFAALTAATALALLPLAAQAGKGPPPPPAAMMAGDDETSLFAGLNFTFGSGQPGINGVVGVIYSEVDAGGDVRGGLMSLNFNLQGNGSPDLRVAGFSGNGDIAGQLGLGVNLGGGGAFGLAGFLTNYTQGGLTFGFDGNVEGFFGLTSYDFLEPRQVLGAPPNGGGNNGTPPNGNGNGPTEPLPIEE